jgi:DNA-binding beta-propeller fold protein YncE
VAPGAAAEHLYADCGGGLRRDCGLDPRLELGAGRQLDQPQGGPTFPNDLVFSPDGSRLYMADEREVSVLTPTEDDNSPLQQTKAITGDLGVYYRSVAVSPDGSRLYAATVENSPGPMTQIWVYDASSLSRIGAGVSLP